MATFYVDKRVAVNGNGSQASPYKAIKEVCAAGVGANAVIEIVEGSGPYYYGTTDFGNMGSSKLYLTHSGLGTVTWNFNGNVLTSEVELINNPLYEWHRSSANPLYYYCTGIGHTNPNFLTVKSGVVNDYWDAESTNIFNGVGGATDITHPQKWGYGNIDALGFNTVYVRGIDPNDTSNSVRISQYPMQLIQADTVSTPANEIFNDLTVKGGGAYAARFGIAITATFNRCRFENTDDYAIYMDNIAGQCIYNYCYFKNNGHQSFACSKGNQTANNCMFENSHTVTKLVSSTAGNTITIRNCKTKNLLAGAIQFDTPSNQTLIEDHNQWHVDMVSTHGGNAIAITSTTRIWTTTAATDFPPSTPTSSDNTFVSPDSIPDGAGAVITGLHDQVSPAKDFNNLPVLFHPPSIGHIDGRKTKIISSTGYAPTGYEVRSPAKLVITGGGDINLEGLTDTGTIDVIATPGSTIKAFTGNGTNTILRAVATNKAPGYSRHFH